MAPSDTGLLDSYFKGCAPHVRRTLSSNPVAQYAALATKDPQAGDVGLAVVRGRLCAAICTGQGWFSRDDRGFVAAPLNAVWKAWRVA